MDRFTLIPGKCEEILPTLPDNSFDAIVTDPPAGIGFMGKEWDKNKGGRDPWIRWMRGIAEECLRVLKPGAHALVWVLPRTSHWTATAWEDAGFELREVVAHLFGTGFPKSLDISKAIDRHGQGWYRRVYVEAVQEAGLALPANSKWDWTKGEHSPGDKWWGIFCEWLPSLSDVDQTKINRIVIDKGFKPRPTFHTSNIGSKAAANEYEITISASNEGQQWDGWGTALKPCREDWLLFRKPSTGTVAANVLEHGTGGLNIDGCRIEFQSESDKAESEGKNQHAGYANPNGNRDSYSGEYGPRANYNGGKGRFPGNVTHDGSEVIKEGIGNDDAARFFYCAKASPEDRNEGLEGLGLMKLRSDLTPKQIAFVEGELIKVGLSL